MIYKPSKTLNCTLYKQSKIGDLGIFFWPRVRLVSAARFPAFFQSPEAQTEVRGSKHGEQKEENVTEVGAEKKKMCGFGGR